MLGPRIAGEKSVELRPPTLEDARLYGRWQLEPEVGRFWGPRFGDVSDEHAEKRFRETAEARETIMWTIAHQSEPVGFTGIFDIDWVARDGESGIFIGRHDLYGRGIASQAVRLRTAYAWFELRLHRVHNWIGVANLGSRRANEKAGYRQVGIIPRAWFRSQEWYDVWLGEAFPETFPGDLLSSPWREERTKR